MSDALQLTGKGCTLGLKICIMMLSEGGIFEYAGKKVIPDSGQLELCMCC